MSINFKGDPLTNEQIAEYARRLREYYCLEEITPPDMIWLMGRDRIFTRFGEKSFEYKIVPDLELEGDEALTLLTQTHVRVRLSKTTYERARDLDRRSRWTLAHEIGHAVLHKNTAELARARQPGIRVIPHHVSVERQAELFAASFLMTEAMVEAATSADDLARIAIVSRTAADIRWEKERSYARRPLIREGLRSLKAELESQYEPVRETCASFPCPVCRMQTLLKIGAKYLCTGPCDQVYDAFPDGDGPGA